MDKYFTIGQSRSAKRAKDPSHKSKPHIKGSHIKDVAIVDGCLVQTSHAERREGTEDYDQADQSQASGGIDTQIAMMLFSFLFILQSHE